MVNVHLGLLFVTWTNILATQLSVITSFWNRQGERVKATFPLKLESFIGAVTQYSRKSLTPFEMNLFVIIIISNSSSNNNTVKYFFPTLINREIHRHRSQSNELVDCIAMHGWRRILCIRKDHTRRDGVIGRPVCWFLFTASNKRLDVNDSRSGGNAILVGHAARESHPD